MKKLVIKRLINSACKFITAATVSLVMILPTSCQSTKEIAYFQDAQNGNRVETAPKHITLQPEDKITIVVNSRNQELSNMFNLPYISRQLGSTNSTYLSSQGISCYTVDKNGEIDFPELGKVKVAGMTRQEVAEHIKNKLTASNLIKDHIVTVEYANLSISVLGEVKSPGRYKIDRDALTLLEAISLAGDLNIHGRRDNIRVLRNEGNSQKTYTVSLLSLEELYNSPAYYLQQNDIVYVEPNKMRARQSTVNGNNVRSSSFWISLASLLSSVITLVTR